jgi:nitroreductase
MVVPRAQYRLAAGAEYHLLIMHRRAGRENVPALSRTDPTATSDRTRPMLADLIRRNRSTRRFDATVPVDMAILRDLVDLARLSASAANRQPLRYLLSSDPATNDRIFPHTAWAGYLTDWPGPAEGERPTAWIVIVGDREVNPTFACDHGIAAQSILLGAAERGLAGCIIASLDREALATELGITDRYEILLALALGRPAEQVVVEDLAPGGDIRYWRDADEVHHVPKRPLEELILATWGD